MGNSFSLHCMDFFIDTELPEFLNCPTEIIKLVNMSGQDAIVTWDPLLVSDNVAVNFATLTGNSDSGDTFPFGGPTAVSFSVEDVSGNINFCNFTVTVSGKWIPFFLFLLFVTVTECC